MPEGIKAEINDSITACYINKFVNFQIVGISSNTISQIILLIEVIFIGHSIIEEGLESLLKGKIKIEFRLGRMAEISQSKGRICICESQIDTS